MMIFVEHLMSCARVICVKSIAKDPIGLQEASSSRRFPPGNAEAPNSGVVVLQCLLLLPQVEFLVSIAKSTAKAQNSGKS